MEYRYKAFISYRHQSPDQEIAGKLHRMIENYRVPSSLAKSLGVRRPGRVFRDQEELQLSSSLGDDIHKALDSSEWLICICSPRYLESAWCMEELRYFISSGRRDHVLAVLVEGEPSDSFPEILRFKEVDGKTVADDPLAADVRGTGLPEQLKKLKSEKLRILSSLLGVRYDDLRQRSRQRQGRLIMAAGSALIVLLSGFLGYAFHKNAQITDERNSALIAESKWLAQSADEALDRGDTMLSLLLSIEALPENFDDPERPVTDEALESLRSAIISGKGDNVYQPVTVIEVQGMETYRASDNTLSVFSRQTEGYISSFDMRTGEELPPGTPIEEEPTWFVFTSGLGGYLIYPDRIQSGSLTVTDWIDKDSFVDYDPYFEYSDQPEYRLVEGMSYSGGGYLLLQQKSGGYTDELRGIFSGFQMNHNIAYRDYAEEGLKLHDAVPLNDNSSQFLISGSRISNGISESAVLRIDVMNSNISESNVVFRYEADQQLKFIDISCDDSVIAGYYKAAAYFWNADDPQPALSITRDRFDGADIEKILFSGSDPSLAAVLCSNSFIYLYDCAKDTFVQAIRPGLYSVADMMWNSDSTRLLLTCSDNAARIVDISDGSILQTIGCSFPLIKAEYGERAYNGNSKNDTYILLAGADRIQIMKLAAGSDDLSMLVRLNDTLSVMSMTADNSYRIAVSPDGSRIWNIHGDGLHVYSSATGDVEKVIEGEDRYSTLYSTERYMISYRNDSGSEAENAIRIYDIDSLDFICGLEPSYPHKNVYINSSGEENVTALGERKTVLSRVYLNDERSLMLAVGSSTDSFPCVFVYSTESWEECWHVGIDSGNGADRIFDCAADWPGSIILDGCFLAGGDKVLCSYTYTPNPKEDFESIRYNARIGYSHILSSADFITKFSRHICFSVRDAGTGEVVCEYHLPYTAVLYYPVPEENVLVIQDTEYSVHIVNAETGDEIAVIPSGSRIFDYAADKNGVRVRFELDGTMDRYASTGYSVSYEGKVEAVQADQMVMSDNFDGYYGGSPFIASTTGLYHAETGQPLVHWDENKYVFIRSSDDGSFVLLFCPFDSSAYGQQNGDVVLLRYAGGAEMRSAALGILGGRELTAEQREQYHLD